MSSPTTPFFDLNTGPSTPDSTDYFVSGESPIKPGSQANEYLRASTIPEALQNIFDQPVEEDTQRPQDTNGSPLLTTSQSDAAPSTPLVQIVPGSSSPTIIDEDVSEEPRNRSIVQISDHLTSAFATTPDRNLLTPTISEAQQSLDSFPFTPNSSKRTTSRQGSTPRCTSPGLSSRRSRNSSDRDRSFGSCSSGEYLTPPLFQPDSDNPPFVPLFDDRNSLTMMGLRRVKTNPSGDEYSFEAERKRKRRSRSRRNKANRHADADHSFWSRSQCQLAPTAPAGQQHLFLEHTDGQHTHPYKAYRRLVSSSVTTFPRIVRRWSSVEIGFHQMPLASSVPLRDPQNSLIANAAGDAFVPAIDLGQRIRSSTFPHGLVEHIQHGIAEQDILETVRQRLSFRESEQSLLETPASITVSRPRVKHSISHPVDAGLSNTWDIKNDLTFGPSVAPHYRKTSLTYLITTKDIESITDLIASNIEAKYVSQGKRMLPRSKSIMFDLPVTSQDERIVKPAGTITDYLQVSPFNERGSSVSRKDSFKSTEVIWQSNPSPGDESSVYEGGLRASPIHSTSDFGTPERRESEYPSSIIHEAGLAFDPDHARTSINKWQNDIPFVVTSSDEDNNAGAGLCTADDGVISSAVVPENHKERQKPKPFLRYRASANAVQDVESFPPLPQRKLTSDWHSPLPDMDTSSPMMSPRSPYNDDSSSRQVTPKASQISWARSEQLSDSQVAPVMSTEFSWNIDAALQDPERLSPGSNHDASPLEEPHRKGVVKHLPCAASRTGSAASMGSSLGIGNHERIPVRSTRPPPPAHTKTAIFPPDASSVTGLQVPSSERRGSSAPRIRRVRTIDNAHKGEHRAECSKWRKPSACPLPQPASPSMFEDATHSGYFDLSLSNGSMPPSSPSHLDRIQRVFRQKTSEVRDTCLPSVKVDQVGIYGQMARVWSDLSGREREEQRGQKRGGSHECDDVANHPERDMDLGVE